MSNDELKRRLRAMAARQTPPVDGRFANRLEADLRAVAVEGPEAHGLRSIFVRPAAIVTMAVLLIGVVFVVRNNEDAPALEFASAEGTSVSIPGDVSERDGVAGLELPEGTRIEVAADGSATVAGVVLEAGTVAMITDGQLELVDAPSVTATSVVDRTPTTAATTTTAVSDRPAVTEASTTRAPDQTDAPLATDVKPTDTPSATTTSTTTAPDRTTTVPPTTVAPTTTASQPTVDEVPLRIRLEVSAVEDRRVTLNWRPNRDAPEITGWEVRIRKGDSTKTLAVLRQRGARRLRVEVSGRDVSYRVIARGQDGEVIARSEFVPLL